MLPDLKVEQMPTAELVPYAGNAKQHPEKQVREIANSIEHFGFADPVGVWTRPDGQLEIVEGHGRVMAAKMLGIDKVPVIRLDHLDDDGRRAYAHVHNQTTLTSGFDMDALAIDIESIPGFDWSEFGFDMPSKETSLDEIIEDELPEEAPSRCERGQVWALGDHRVMCGDSTSNEDVLRLMGGCHADMLLTDPPYNVDYHGAAGSIENDAFKNESDFSNFLVGAFKAASSGMKEGAAFYVWFASTHSPAVYSALASTDLEAKQELEWVKTQFTIGRQDYQWAHEPCVYGWKKGAGHYFTDRRNEWTVIDDAMDTRKMTKTQLREALENILQNGVETTVLRYAKPSVSDLHPTTKPVKLFARLMRNSSRDGENVLDLFGGSGTTLIAAEQLGRRAYLMELDPRFCDVIIKRWEDFTGETANLIA